MSTTPRIVADFESQLATAVSIGSTTFDLSSVLDDDNVSLPAGTYCFTIDNGSSVKEYLQGVLSGSSVSSVKSISRQGIATTGAARAHRVGASVIITDFVAIKRVADILAGLDSLDGNSPLIYDTAPTLSDGKQVATVAYVLSVVTGGTVNFSSQTIAAIAGETLVTTDSVYFKTSDQRWWKTDADLSATYEGVRKGIVVAGNTAGGGITVQLSGVAVGFSGKTPGAQQYLSNTAGALSETPGTATVPAGWAVSATTVLLDYNSVVLPSFAEKTALAAITPYYNTAPVVHAYTAGTTWTKPAGLKYVTVELVGGGENGGGFGNGAGPGANAGGAAGGYSKKTIAAATLGATETVTVGALQNTSSFGTHCSATGGISGVSGTGTGGDLNIAGSAPGDGVIGDGTTDAIVGGDGGSTPLGRGGQGARTNSASAGKDGSGYGSGGGGGGKSNNGSTVVAASNGKPGIVIVTEYFL